MSLITVNRDIFVVKIFSDSMDSAKIKHTKIISIINNKRYGVVCLKII